jgi:hypothetical protein
MTKPVVEKTTCCVCGDNVGVVQPLDEDYILRAVACKKRKCIDHIINHNELKEICGIHFFPLYIVKVSYKAYYE